jgi:predicted nucleic acid-binding protein
MNAVLIDTNVFIEHLHSRLNILSLLQKTRDRRRYKYSFVTARELLCLDGEARVIPSAAPYVGSHDAGLSTSTVFAYLIRGLFKQSRSERKGLRQHGKRPQTCTVQRQRPNANWLRCFRRELYLLKRFECLPVTPQIRSLAHELLRKAAMSEAHANDAIIAATALLYKMTLLSADCDFDAFGLRRIAPNRVSLGDFSRILR